MPELPEVETIRRGLEKEVIGKRIVKIQIKNYLLIKNISVHEFSSRLKGSSIKNIKRRGKFFIFVLAPRDNLIIHLGMSGIILYRDDPEKTKALPFSKIKENHNHIIFFFEDNSRMIYNDVRRFGKIWLLKNGKTLPCIESLGFEPLGYKFTFESFYGLLQKNKKNIKSFLMNQKNIAGIGNIYANEILFLSGIHPLRKSNSLTFNEAKKIYLNTRNILRQAIELGGTTMNDESYLDSGGKKGSFGETIMVYGKKGRNCPLCEKPLEIIKIDNRSTFLCPGCQK